MEIRINIEIEKWPITRLIPRITNPRTHTPEQVAQIVASIREFGWTNPVLVGADNDVIAGHARLLAARQLGMAEVPVIQLGHLSEAQRRALVIADNQLTISAGWSEETLRIELQALQEADFDLTLVGFDEDELARLLAAEEATSGLTDEDAVPEVLEAPISVAGDLWRLGQHVLLVGDATNEADVARLMNGEGLSVAASRRRSSPYLGRLQIAGLRNPVKRCEALGTRENGHVPGRLLVYAPAIDPGAAETRHSVPQSLPPIEWSLESSPARQRIGRHPHTGPACGAPGLWRGEASVDVR